MKTPTKPQRNLPAGNGAARVADSLPKKGAESDVPPKPKEPDTKTFNGRVAKRLRALRHKRKLSVDAFMAELVKHGVDVNRSLVYAWENGSKLIHPNNYPAISRALGCKSVKAFLPDE